MSNTNERIERSTRGLKVMMFDELDSLRAGTTSNERLRTLATATTAIIRTERLAMDRCGIGEVDTLLVK